MADENQGTNNSIIQAAQNQNVEVSVDNVDGTEDLIMNGLDNSSTQVIEINSAVISDSSTQITEAIRELKPESSFSDLVLGALIAAFTAFIFNLMFWYFVRSREKSKSYCQRISAQISVLENLAIDYWLSDYDPSTSKTLEVKILSKIKFIDSYINKTKSEWRKSLNSSQINDILRFASDFYDCVTGDDFRSETRSASEVQAMKAAKICLVSQSAIAKSVT